MTKPFFEGDPSTSLARRDFNNKLFEVLETIHGPLGDTEGMDADKEFEAKMAFIYSILTPAILAEIDQAFRTQKEEGKAADRALVFLHELLIILTEQTQAVAIEQGVALQRETDADHSALIDRRFRASESDLAIDLMTESFVTHELAINILRQLIKHGLTIRELLNDAENLGTVKIEGLGQRSIEAMRLLVSRTNGVGDVVLEEETIELIMNEGMEQSRQNVATMVDLLKSLGIPARACLTCANRILSGSASIRSIYQLAAAVADGDNVEIMHVGEQTFKQLRRIYQYISDQNESSASSTSL